MKKITSFEKGFTVLEFLVVLAIIGILIAVALTGIDLSRERARDNTRISDMQNIALSLQQYNDVCREYPYDIYDLNSPSDNGCPNNVTWESFATPILKDGLMPTDPVDGSQYSYVGISIYINSPVCVGYHLGAYLEQEENKLLANDANANSIPYPICGNNSLLGLDATLPANANFYDVIVNYNS